MATETVDQATGMSTPNFAGGEPVPNGWRAGIALEASRKLAASAGAMFRDLSAVDDETLGLRGMAIRERERRVQELAQIVVSALDEASATEAALTSRLAALKGSAPAAPPAAPARPSLKDVAHGQSDVLSDVRALLKAVMDAPEVEVGDHLDRLVMMADEKIQSVRKAFDPYI